jgi:hypothetical protein
MNLLAFGVIAEIDDYYARSLRNNFSQYLVQEGQLCFSKLGKDESDPLEVNKAGISRVIYYAYRTLQLLYDSIYFYFTPYLVICVTFVIN